MADDKIVATPSKWACYRDGRRVGDVTMGLYQEVHPYAIHKTQIATVPEQKLPENLADVIGLEDQLGE